MKRKETTPIKRTANERVRIKKLVKRSRQNLTLDEIIGKLEFLRIGNQGA